MLDLVLAWGSLDNAFGMLLSAALGKPLDEGAEQFSKLPSSDKLQRVCTILKQAPNGEDAARKLRRLKRQLEKHSKTRNRIAHSHCIGIWALDPEYIVFLPFEKVSDGELVCELIPIEEMKRAIRWGHKMRDLVLKLEDTYVKHTT